MRDTTYYIIATNKFQDNWIVQSSLSGFTYIGALNELLEFAKESKLGIGYQTQWKLITKQERDELIAKKELVI